MSWKQETTKTGYNVEELYFEKLNRELINQIKTKGIPTETTKQESLAEVIPFKPREKTEKKVA